ncbi:alpha/beta-hydrolase [Eremomyces bilateralis CBS 781.70]|uniref:Carboxylic ester hydrolase n=1 Tax=Eremomyces bilateralis CBS 781.70 TaxID=1392243 RepID=A0A6G1FSE1_9PEZI|nr:alpha/beta-hydrolase [Eremomyces bilateralis CBS 781.70]KAF1808628.1 alpha/beta-hydrolase [Eremomyces bilateralis CBS 781.70]
MFRRKRWQLNDSASPAESKPPSQPWDVPGTVKLPIFFLRLRFLVCLVVLALVFTVILVVLAVTNVFDGTEEQIPTVTVRNGTVEGVYLKGYDQDQYLGVPYAAAPVDDLRFRNPQPLAEGWGPESFKAREHQKACIGYTQGSLDQSEDCLYLNIVRTRTCQGGCPVVVWIHGGAYTSGSPTDPQYDMSFIAHQADRIGKPMIAVSIAYRLSVWGFLFSNQTIESGDTNMGLRDQRLALRWVQENIAAFGGDPSKITLMGESAGASSVGYHLTAYGGQDEKLFRAAIMQSGSPIFYGSINDIETQQILYDDLANQTGCGLALDSLRCLREQPFERIDGVVRNNATLWLSWNPAIDGDFIQNHTSTQLSEGAFVRVPILTGVNADEGTGFTPYGIYDDADFFYALTNKTYVQGVSEALATELGRIYADDLSQNIPATAGTYRPPYPQGNQWRRAATYFGDATFHANKRLTCQAWASHEVPAYCYLFDALPNASTEDIMGVAHFVEVPYVFYNLQGKGHEGGPRPFDHSGARYLELARLMCHSWVSFIDTMDPNGFRQDGGEFSDLEAWPRYGTDGRNFVFTAERPCRAELDDYRADGIALINEDPANTYNR